MDDMEQFLSKTNPDLTAEEVRQIMDNVRLVGAESDFATLHKVYGWMVDGVQFTPQAGLPRMVNLIDFENPENNLFRAVNQFTVEYTNNGPEGNPPPGCDSVRQRYAPMRHRAEESGRCPCHYL